MRGQQTTRQQPPADISVPSSNTTAQTAVGCSRKPTTHVMHRTKLTPTVRCPLGMACRQPEPAQQLHCSCSLGRCCLPAQRPLVLMMQAVEHARCRDRSHERIVAAAAVVAGQTGSVNAAKNSAHHCWAAVSRTPLLLLLAPGLRCSDQEEGHTLQLRQERVVADKMHGGMRQELQYTLADEAREALSGNRLMWQAHTAAGSV